MASVLANLSLPLPSLVRSAKEVVGGGCYEYENNDCLCCLESESERSVEGCLIIIIIIIVIR